MIQTHAHTQDLQKEPGSILYCDCANTRIIPEEKKECVRELLSRSGRPVVKVSDLCGLAAKRDPRLAQLAQSGRLTVVACYPRAVRWLFHQAGVPLEPERVRFLNMRVQTAADMVAVLEDGEQRAPVADPPLTAAGDENWRPWFPVIDYDRCTGCRQCLEFCLFGVYESDAAGRVQVTRPGQCKDNCPACARMCPALAIMFPKIDEESPINGSDDDAVSAPGKVCLTREQLFGENAIDKLRARQQRPSLFK